MGNNNNENSTSPLSKLRAVFSRFIVYEKASAADTREEWHDELSRDKEELHADIQRDKDKMHEIADDIRHPHKIMEKAENAARETEEKAEQIASALAHPSKIVHDIENSIDNKRHELDETAAEISSGFSSAKDKERLPIIMKIFGVLLIAGSILAIPGIVKSGLKGVSLFQSGGMSGEGTSTIVVSIVHVAVLFSLAITLIVFGIRLVKNQRRWAAIISYTIYILIILGTLCSIMLEGISIDLVFYLVAMIVAVALQSYLDPTLLEERRAHRRAIEAEERQRGIDGTLGRDLSGKGYITLNFFNLFWIFVAASFIGLMMEEFFHFLFVVPGQWQDRAGLLFGPFSPIYGFGAVLMTIFLNRFHKSSVIVIFVVAAVIGGLFEALTSVFMQYAFGAVAWDYSNMPGSLFGGRTCLPFMAVWGLLGVAWIKLLLPFMLHLVNLIPWNWRYTLTAIATVLMIVDGVMTLQSLDCWYERLSGDPVDTPIQQFYDKEFDNQYMENRFQSMTINPTDATRSS